MSTRGGRKPGPAGRSLINAGRRSDVLVSPRTSPPPARRGRQKGDSTSPRCPDTDHGETDRRLPRWRSILVWCILRASFAVVRAAFAAQAGQIYPLTVDLEHRNRLQPRASDPRGPSPSTTPPFRTRTPHFAAAGSAATVTTRFTFRPPCLLDHAADLLRGGGPRRETPVLAFDLQAKRLDLCRESAEGRSSVSTGRNASLPRFSAIAAGQRVEPPVSGLRSCDKMASITASANGRRADRDRPSKRGNSREEPADHQHRLARRISVDKMPPMRRICRPRRVPPTPGRTGP